MPTFTTPGPISATIDLAVGDARITASDRGDTVVEVRPSNAAVEADVRAAELIRVEFADGRLLVKSAKQRTLGLFGKAGSVDVTIALPTGSRLQADAAMASIHGTGQFGDCRVKTAAGDVHLDHTGTLDLNTSIGTIVLRQVDGDAQISCGSGRVRCEVLGSTAVVKNSNGDTWIGTVAGDLRVKAANGSILVDRAGADVTASSSNGDVRIGEVVRGAVSVTTSLGQLEVGIREGTAALLDLHTSAGKVHNRLSAVDAPAQQDERVEIRARTSFGDIVIRRS
ncbi:DUF4097 and DUF4098 domain-containing protein YvlB [Allocatelliglobosispora scoriae]|uniref:DUF4097 and DUF4098 domain-containing protein YvlB n=1 Tax=Allocatelliglobosispora scoriae TaxID=643052 RepID=A0A841BLE7_9ACTN|nr:DUF4097 family beta strand repeat-containing protein [Allocatelliglobosispora scoriae]MBB5867640.1 DUF4097 and DUF4098 domain-containing protein YvlB [Allocatelliglobosispora scoriae]